MKISRLLELASKDNPTLVEYAKRWVGTRNPSLKDEIKKPDPVSQAIAWKDKTRNAFSAALLVFLMMLLLGLAILLFFPEEKNTRDVLFLCVLVGFLVALIFLVKGIWSYFDKPTDTGLFLEVITLLENTPVERAGVSNSFMGSFPIASEWRDLQRTRIVAMELLREQANEICELESRLGIPWRFFEINQKKEQRKALFSKKHFLLRRLFPDIPESWSSFFIKK